MSTMTPNSAAIPGVACSDDGRSRGRANASVTVIASVE